MESQWPQEEKDRRADLVLYNVPDRSIIEQVNEAVRQAGDAVSGCRRV
jgi:hypothetical protein